jgi:Family of unknown function (DUF6494)
MAEKQILSRKPAPRLEQVGDEHSKRVPSAPQPEPISNRLIPGSQQAIEQVVRDENLKGKLKVKMVLTGEGTDLNHVVEGEIDLPEAL